MSTEPTETLVLLQNWHEGDQQALDALIRRDLDWIRTKVEKRLGEGLRKKTDPEDVVQEAMIEVLRYGPRFLMSSRKQFRTLMARIIENAIRGQASRLHAARRDMGREQSVPRDSLLALDPMARSVTRPSQAFARKEASDWVRIGLELVSPTDREILIARQWDGRAFAEIGEQLGIDEVAARMRFHRALQRLGKIVKKLRSGQINAVLESDSDPGDGEEES